MSYWTLKGRRVMHDASGCESGPLTETGPYESAQWGSTRGARTTGASPRASHSLYGAADICGAAWYEDPTPRASLSSHGVVFGFALGAPGAAWTPERGFVTSWWHLFLS